MDNQPQIRIPNDFDHRGARSDVVPFVDTTERRERFLGVWHALTVRHLLQLKRGGRCTLGVLDGRGGGTDPVAIDAGIASIGMFLKDCTAEERYAIALELLEAGRPVDHGHRPPPTKRKRQRDQSRCDLLEAAFGREYSFYRYHALVDGAYRKIEARMQTAGVLWDGR